MSGNISTMNTLDRAIPHDRGDMQVPVFNFSSWMQPRIAVRFFGKQFFFFFSCSLLQWYQNNKNHSLLLLSMTLPIIVFPIICLLLIWSFYHFPSNERMAVFSFLVVSVEHDRKYQNIGIYFHDCICSQNIFLLQSKAFSKSHCT